MARVGLAWAGQMGTKVGFFVLPFIIQGFGMASVRWLSMSIK